MVNSKQADCDVLTATATATVTVTATATVTVAVITYHSEKTIIDTLDSILVQTYNLENIELIISDDASTDNTVAVVDSWLNVHSHKFRAVKLIANDNNGGVSKNCNIVWQAATSVWIKTIAGDDLLYPTCIKDNMMFVSDNPHVEFLFSSMVHFKSEDITHELLITPTKRDLHFFELKASEQFYFLMKKSFNIAPTSFMKKNALSSVGFCCEKYRYIEDLPLWLKLTRTGHKLYYMNKETVRYRISDSLSNSITRLVNINFIQQVHLIHKKEIWPYLPPFQRWRVYDKQVEYFSWIIPYKIFNNKRNRSSLAVHYILSCFRPLAAMKILERIRRK